MKVAFAHFRSEWAPQGRFTSCMSMCQSRQSGKKKKLKKSIHHDVWLLCLLVIWEVVGALRITAKTDAKKLSVSPQTEVPHWIQ